MIIGWGQAPILKQDIACLTPSGPFCTSQAASQTRRRALIDRKRQGGKHMSNTLNVVGRIVDRAKLHGVGGLRVDAQSGDAKASALTDQPGG